MKKSLHVFVVLICFFVVNTSVAQVVDVPNKAKEHFFKKYPDAKNADWNNNVVNYAVKFTYKDATNRAYYKMNGNWDYTETYLEETLLPEPVKSSFSKSRFSDWDKESFASVENSKGKFTYRIEVKKGIDNNCR